MHTVETHTRTAHFNDLTALTSSKNNKLFNTDHSDTSNRKQPNKGGKENKEYIKSLYRKYLGKENDPCPNLNGNTDRKNTIE